MWFGILLMVVYFGAILFPIFRKIVGALSLRHISDFTAKPISLLCRDQLQFRAFRDIHGQEVLYSRKLFPCFDGFDRATEDRHYRHFLVFHEEGVTAVRASNDSTSVSVPNDITRRDAAKKLDLWFNGDEQLQKTPYWERLPEPSEPS